MSLKGKFVQLITDKLCIVKEDLTHNEESIINISFALLKEKLEDLKLANETIHRLEIENKNLKSYNDNTDYHSDIDDADDTGDDY